MYKLFKNARAAPQLSGPGILLRAPAMSDFAQWARARHESSEFLRKWEPAWAGEELSCRSWRARVRSARAERRNGTGFVFVITLADSAELIGGISLARIRRGAARSAQIGYWMHVAHAGQGHMARALARVIRFSFDELMLHRLEAACIPGNTRSEKLLKTAGFRQEGLLRSYLRINGAWRDHNLFALICGDERAFRDGQVKRGLADRE